MSYARIRTNFINISSTNKRHIYSYQKWSLFNVAVSAILYFVVIHSRDGINAIPYESTLQEIVGLLFFIGTALFVGGLFLHAPKQIYLLSEFGKKTFLVNPTVSNNIANFLAWFLPVSVFASNTSVFLNMTFAYKLSMFAVVAIVVFARVRSNFHRYAAFEQFKIEYPYGYFERLDEREPVFR